MDKDFNNRFSPRQELDRNNTPGLYRRRTAVIFFTFLIFFMLWAFCCRSCIDTNVSGTIGFGSGSSDHGTGSGSGNSGKCSGAGEEGSGNGKFDNALASGGIGKDKAPAGTENPDTGKTAVDGAPVRPRLPELQKTPLYIESIAVEIPTPAPAKIVAHQYTGGTVQGRKGFYGMAVRKTSRVLFIVDCSSSMAAASAELPGKNRMEVMKMEMEKAVFPGNSTNSLSGGFAIVTFSHHVQIFPEKGKGLCKYTSSKSMKKAEKFINQLNSGGGTNMKMGWTAALELIKKYKITTVYFLTDGEPGDGFDTTWLKQAVKKHKLRYPLQINCFSIGKHGRKLMEEIATEFKGSFVFIP